MKLTAVFETWHIGDGNYPPLHKGQLVNLSFELEPYALSKLSSSNSIRFEQIKDAEYSFAGTVSKVYGDPHDGEIVLIEAGGFRFYINSFPKGAPSLKENEMVEGYGRLLLDHYIWVEFLSEYRDPPDLSYALRVTRIRSVKIPDVFISPGEKVASGPASLNREEYSRAVIKEIERMGNAEEDWLFYLVDLDSSDIGTARVPRTFRSKGI